MRVALKYKSFLLYFLVFTIFGCSAGAADRLVLCAGTAAGRCGQRRGGAGREFRHRAGSAGGPAVGGAVRAIR